MVAFLEFQNTERDGRDYYYVDTADGTVVFDFSEMEIYFCNDSYKCLNGTYIGLPDQGQVDAHSN